MRFLTVFFLMTFIHEKSFAQSQWFPAIVEKNEYIRDTTLFRYPVTNLIEKNGKLYLYGRGTRYPTPMAYNKNRHFFYSDQGILMTSRTDNIGYHLAYYQFTIKDKRTAILTIKKKDGVIEKIIFLKSLLPVSYPQGN